MKVKTVFKIFKVLFGILVKVVEVSVAFLLVIGVLGFWKLSVQPANVDFLMPQLSSYIIPKESGLLVTVDSVMMEAKFRRKGLLHIRIKDLSVLRSDGSVVTKTPEIVMSYGLLSVLTLSYLPDTVVVKEPKVQAIIDPEGKLFIQNHRTEVVEKTPVNKEVAEPGTIEVTPKEPVTDEQEKPARRSVLTQVQIHEVRAIVRNFLKFDAFSIENGSFVIDDQKLGRTFSISNVNALLEWPRPRIHTLAVSGKINSQKVSADFNFNLTYDKKTKQAPFDLTVGGIDLSQFSDFFPILAGNDLMMRASMAGNFDLTQGPDNIRNGISGVSFKLVSEKPGRINLPSPLTNVYNIKSAVIEGRFAANLKTMTVENSLIVLAQGPTATLDVDVTGIDVFLDTFDPAHLQVTLKSSVQKATVNQVPSLWPSALGPDAHEWARQNLSGGIIPKADFTLYFKGFELVDLFGKLNVSGATVRYLEEMPVVVDAAGEVLLYPDRVEIMADRGVIGNLKLKQAKLYFTELERDVSNAKIELDVSGPIREALTLIASKPLEFPQMFGLDPAKTSGSAAAYVSLSFPLLEEIELNQVKVAVSAKMTGAVLPTDIDGLDLTNGLLNLKVDNQRLVVDGFGDIQNLPVTLQWTEYFDAPKKDSIKSQYDVSASIKSSLLKMALPEIESYMSGEIPLRVKVEKKSGGAYSYDVSADLKNSVLHLYPLSVVKEKSIPASLSVSGRGNEKNDQFDISFKMDSPDKNNPIHFEGLVKQTSDLEVRLNHVQTKDSRFELTYKKDKADNVFLEVLGTAWNASGIFEMPLFTSKNEEKIAKRGIHRVEEDLKEVPSLDIDISLSSLTLEKELPLRNVGIKLVRDKAVWKELFCVIQGAKTFTMGFDADKNRVHAQTQDMGDLFKRLGISARISGGLLSLSGVPTKTGGLKGRINAKDYSYKDPGFFVQAFTILGIVNGIVSNELSFKEAVIPFEISPGFLMQVNEGYASGNTLGITFDGQMTAESISLSGSVLPAYVINSLLGRIPLIGGLFRDGKGGGLVGVRYEIVGDTFNPSVNFNPLASMAPGALGRFFR
ncbi:MAG: hypothetical protein LBU87_06165 [Lactobacillales bacterium]|jgi:hypothetical protein|nr:hypothetical protein [Lactobacillales bacterium]